jgi:hypothetical protein
LTVVIGIFCTLLLVTQLQFPRSVQTLAADGWCALGLLVFWKMGRSDLMLLKSLLHPAGSN